MQSISVGSRRRRSRDSDVGDGDLDLDSWLDGDAGDLLHHVRRAVQVDEALVDPAWRKHNANHTYRWLSQLGSMQDDKQSSANVQHLCRIQNVCMARVVELEGATSEAGWRTASRSGPRCWYPHRKATCGW